MAIYTVSSQSELQAALSSASGGDEILLEAGNYGELSLSQDFSSDVTIRAIDPLSAEFGAIEISGASHLVLDGLRVDSGGNDNHIDISNSHHITVQNSDVGAESGFAALFGIRSKDSSNISYINNYIHNVANGTAMFSTDDVVVSGNVVDWITDDSYKFSGANGGLVENNWGAAHEQASADAHNDFMQFQGDESYNFVIRGNVLIPAEGEIATTQGIFGNLSDSLIEQNIIVAANARAISVHDGNIIQDNTLLDVPGQAADDTKIYTDGSNVIENNIWTSNKGGIDGSNIIVQHDDSDDVNYIYDLFTDFHGTGTSLDGLIPVDGSAADGKGAYARLIELLTDEEPVANDAAPEAQSTPEKGTASVTEPIAETSPTSDPVEISPAEDDTIMGDGANNDIAGTSETDVIVGRNGDDTLSGEGGDDKLKGQGGNDDLHGGSGDDLLNGGRKHDLLVGNDGADKLIGLTGKDKLLGGDGDDVLQGRKGNDTLDGGAGNDLMDGGRGNDILIGGSGADTFTFRLSPGHDTILDFEVGIDLIDLSNFDIDASKAANVVTDALSDGETGAVFNFAALGTKGTVTLQGVDAGDLETADFVL